MVVLPLSNQFSLCTPRLTLSFASKFPQFTTLESNQHTNYRLSYKHISGLCQSLSSRPSFTSLCTVKHIAGETSDQDKANSDDLEEFRTDADEESLLSTKSLLHLYKEAVLNGDDKTTYDIEAMICHVEKEKIEMFQQFTALSAEISSGKEKYIRLQADFDNYRKRSEKEKLSVRSNAQGEVIESLLPMIDNFERAKQQLKLETEQEKKIDASYQGIYKQFVEIMRSLRVAAVPTVGKPFDPLVHEAIAREESEEFNEGLVTQEFRRGFLLGERLLRPAMVKVSAGPGGGAKPNSSVESSVQQQTPNVE